MVLSYTKKKKKDNPTKAVRFNNIRKWINTQIKEYSQVAEYKRKFQHRWLSLISIVRRQKTKKMQHMCVCKLKLNIWDRNVQ